VDEQTTTRYFAYDGGSIVLELAEVGEGEDKHYELEKEHVRGLSLGGGIGGLLYTRDADGTTGYFHYDGQGNVVSVTNEAREEIAYYEYDAWGNILTGCGSLANEFAFSTKQASTGTGLIDFGLRHYDPQTARWLTRDPVRLDGGLNLYAYCLGHPIDLIDPDGLKARTFWGAAAELGALAGGGALGGSVFGPVGAVVGGIAGAGVWAWQQFGTDHENCIEDMSAPEVVNQIVFDFCIGATTGYLSGYAYATLSSAYAYYAAGTGAGAIAAEEAAAAENATTTVRHYTNEAGRQAITQSGCLRPGTYVTVPSQIPVTARPAETEKILEIAPGKASCFIDVTVRNADLAIPPDGPVTSGGALQWILRIAIGITQGTWGAP
jgi:RHS repeat-associated protein